MNKLFSITGAFGIAIIVMLLVTFPYFAFIAIVSYMILQERNK